MKFYVPGVPAPQGSKKGFAVGGRAILVDDNRPKLREWRASVAQAASDANHLSGWPILDEPVAILVTFIMPRPKSAPKWKFWADKRPDVDKLLRNVDDALTGTVLSDDARVVVLMSTKQLSQDGRTGAEITVWPLGEYERSGVVFVPELVTVNASEVTS